MSDNPITPLTPAEIAAQGQITRRDSYAHRDAVAVDELVNVLLDGSPDETISSRMARWATEDDGWKQHVGGAVSRVLNVLQPDHGAKAEAADRARAEAADAIEKTAEGAQ